MIKKLLVPVIAVATLAGCQTMPSGQAMSYEPVSRSSSFVYPESAGSSVPMFQVCSRGQDARQLPSVVTLTPRKNCKGDGTSTFGQRNELRTDAFSSNRKAKYVFESDVSFNVEQNSIAQFEKFMIFQVHTGITAGGCTPPLVVEVSSDSIGFRGGWWGGKRKKTHKGNIQAENCLEVAVRDRKVSSVKEMRQANAVQPAKHMFKRDGTVQHLRVEVDFKGDKSFETVVFIDGNEILRGIYSPPYDTKRYSVQSQYALKFGLYSFKNFDYNMTWTNPTLLKLK